MMERGKALDEKRRFAEARLEKIVGLGLCIIALLLISLIVIWWYAPAYCTGMLKVVGFQVVGGGRASGISAGLAAGLPKWLVVVLAFFVDMTAVCLLYPLVIYFYEHGVRQRLLGETIVSTLESARRQRSKLSRYGIIGLILFVWFPFYMTGPLIGAVIGYFIGLRPWVNLATVGSGTLLAIISLTFFFDLLYRLLEEVASGLTKYVPFVVVGLVLAGLAAMRLRRGKKGAQTPADGEAPEASDRDRRG